MTIKPRSPGQTAISISVPAELLDEIDARAAALALNRSQYLTMLARKDIVQKGPMTIHETKVVTGAQAKPVKPVTYRKPKRKRANSAPKSPDKTGDEILDALRRGDAPSGESK